MSRRPFPRKIVFGSLLRGRSRVIPVFAALSLAAALSTALFNLYADLDAKLHREFRVFGPNLSLVAKSGRTLPADTQQRVSALLGPDDIAVGSAFAVAQAPDGMRVVVNGAAQRLLELNPSWKVEGGAPGILVGNKAWNALHLNGNDIRLAFRGKEFRLSGYGRLTTGGPEDERIYLPLASFQEWTAEPVSVIDLRISGKAAQVAAQMTKLQSAMPEVQITPLRQVTETQTAVFEKSSAMLGWASAMIVAVLLLCAAAALSSSVLDRRRDFAVMRALGASLSQVRLLLMRETILVSAMAAVTGFIFGCLLAAWIGEASFGTTVRPRLIALQWIFPATIAAGMLSTLWPQMLLARIQPAVLLKGE